MAEVKDKVVTLEGLRALYDYIIGTFLKKSGDIMTGNLQIEKSSSEDNPTITLKNTVNDRQTIVSMDNNTGYSILGCRLDEDNRQILMLHPETESLDSALRVQRKIDGTTTNYTVYHTGNRPSGSYTGDESTTKRTIDIGGVGSTLKISTGNGMAIVTGAGAIVKKYNETTVYGLKASECNFSNGVLTLATADTVVNGSRELNYQVL